MDGAQKLGGSNPSGLTLNHSTRSGHEDYSNRILVCIQGCEVGDCQLHVAKDWPCGMTAYESFTFTVRHGSGAGGAVSPRATGGTEVAERQSWLQRHQWLPFCCFTQIFFFSSRLASRRLWVHGIPLTQHFFYTLPRPAALVVGENALSQSDTDKVRITRDRPWLGLLGSA